MPMDAELRRRAEETRGFMPPDEGLALYEAALEGGRVGPILEVGTWCGKSTVYLAAAAHEIGGHVVTVDHHRGSEENQPGWEYHEPDLVDPAVGKLETLPHARRTIVDAGIEDVVTMIIGRSTEVAGWWGAPCGMVFIDGGHAADVARADYEAWIEHVAPGGLWVIHDVFEHPEDGGQAPHDELYRRALDTGDFEEISATGSLRVLRRNR